MPIKTPIDVKFGQDEMTYLEKFVYDNLTALKNSLSDLHENKVPKWRRLYKGTPAEEERDFPWPNASNIVIQLIGENVDILKARIIGSIYEIMPLWTMKLTGEWLPEEEGEEQRAAMESFMDLMGMEPSELDLYRVESLAANDMVQLGSVVIKSPWETDIEALVTGDALEGGKPAFVEHIRYDGPRPEKLAFEDWGATPTAPTIDKADFKFHHYTLKKFQFEEKLSLGLFEDNESTKKLLSSPDREGVDTLTTEKLKEQNIQAQQGSGLAEWDFYECWFPYFKDGTTYRIVYTYHLKTRTKMRAFFNFYPGNEEPFEMGRLGFTNDGLYGYGFAEMLEYYQEEVSTGHNQRVDNRTLANTSVFFAGQNAKIDSGYALFPGAVLPFNAQDVGIEQLGANYPTSVPEEELTIALAKSRAGVDQGTSGSGSGITNPKKGNYSAMGTFSIMQAGNRRVNINITDFRYMHLKVGRKALKQYAEFGIGDRQRKFGNQSQYIIKALDNIKKGRLELPIRAASASVNEEVEKQNGMLFSQIMQKHYGAIANVFQGIQNPTMPEELKEYLLGSVSGMAAVMSRLLRAFGYDDISRLQPELEIIKKIRQGAANNGNQKNNGQRSSQAEAQPNNTRESLSALSEVNATQR